MRQWPIKPLGNYVLPTGQRDPRENPTRDFSYVDIASVDNKEKTIVTTKQIVGADAPSRARKVIQTGDVIVSTVRPNLNAVALVPSSLDNDVCSTGFSVLRPSEKLLSKYLFAFVRSSAFIGHLTAKTTGASYPAVTDHDVKNVPIPISPLAEQERIVRRLDEVDEMRKLRVHADDRTAALIPALFNEMFGDPQRNPHGWPTKELRELGRIVTGRTPPSAKEGMFGGTIPFITPGDLERNTRITMRFVTEAGAAQAQTVRAGSTMVCCIGATIGKTDRALVRSAFNQQINAIEWREEVDDDFGTVCMKQCSALVISQGSNTALPILKKSLFEKIRLLVPPLPLQKEFAERVAEIRALEAEQAESRRRLDELLQSMFGRAFSGEL